MIQQGYADSRQYLIGYELTDFIGQLICGIQSNLVNPAISVANFIYEGLVA